MQRYFKTVWGDGSIGIFSSNNLQANLIYANAVTDEGGKMIEITKREYSELEKEIE